MGIPVALGFNVGNTGIGVVPNGPEWQWQIVGSDPTSGAAFGILDSTSINYLGFMPDYGWYPTGWRVTNNNPATFNTTLGWIRITTGTGNVLGTDWIELQPAFVVRKLVDEAYGATGIGPDTKLKFNIAASAKVEFTFDVFYNTPTAADFKFYIAGPAAATLVDMTTEVMGPDDTAWTLASQTAFSFGPTVVTAAVNTKGHIIVRGVIHNGANAGVISFDWAQNAASGTTTVYAGSKVDFCRFG
jgi:hypothetical protein